MEFFCEKTMGYFCKGVSNMRRKVIVKCHLSLVNSVGGLNIVDLRLEIVYLYGMCVTCMPRRSS